MGSFWYNSCTYISIIDTDMENFAEKPPKRHDKEEQENPDELTRRDFITGAVALGAITAATKFSTPEATVEEGEKLSELERFKSLIPEGLPVSVELDENGQLEFKHEDQITTEMLNYLAGRGEITEAILAACLRERMFNVLKTEGVDVSTDEMREYLYSINTFSELVNFFTQHANSFDESYWIKYEAGSAEEFGRNLVLNSARIERESRQKIDKKLYQELWHLFIDVGAPRIESVDTAAERKKHKNHLSANSDYFTADQDGSNRVVHLDFSYASARMLKQVVQEFSHSYIAFTDVEGSKKRKQFQKELIGSIEGLSPVEISAARTIAYRTPGTEEYYAHEVIMPTLMERLEKYYPDFQKEWQNTKEEMARKMQEHLKNQENSIE